MTYRELVRLVLGVLDKLVAIAHLPRDTRDPVPVCNNRTASFARCSRILCFHAAAMDINEWKTIGLQGCERENIVITQSCQAAHIPVDACGQGVAYLDALTLRSLSSSLYPPLNILLFSIATPKDVENRKMFSNSCVNGY